MARNLRYGRAYPDRSRKVTDYSAERSYWIQEAAELRRMLATGKLSQEATDDYRRALGVAEEREGNALLASLI